MTFVKSAAIKVTVLLFLSVGTILFFNLYDRYVVIGPELLTNNRFQNNLAEWDHSSQGVSIMAADTDVVRLDSNNSANIIELSQTVPEVTRYRLLRLSCDMKTLNIPQGDTGWNTARVILVSHNHQGEPIYHLPHTLIHLQGTHEWDHHVGVFAVNAETTKVRVSAQLAQATGTMWVKNLSLLPLTEKTSFRRLHKVVILLWVFASLWIVVPVIKSAFGNRHRIAIILLSLAIMFGVLIPENLKEHIGNSLLPSLMEPSVFIPASNSFEFTPLLPSLDLYKIGHFVMFAILAAAVFYRRPYPVSRTRMLIYLLLFALVTEVLQLFVIGRSAQIGDWLIDSAGIATGFTLLRATLFLFPHHK